MLNQSLMSANVRPMSDGGAEHGWSFLTTHGLAFSVIAHDPHARMRDIGDAIGVTERTAQRVVTDLIDAGYVQRERPRRRNIYTVQADSRVRLPLQRDVQIGELLAVLGPASTTTAPPTTPRADSRSDQRVQPRPATA